MSYLNTLNTLAPNATEVNQFKNCQCGWAWFGSNAIVYSYDTIVAVVFNGTYNVTTKNYSQTTTRQINKMSAVFIDFQIADACPDTLQVMANAITSAAITANS